MRTPSVEDSSPGRPQPPPAGADATEPLDALIRRLAEGDRAAFMPAFQALWPVTLRVCTTLMGHESDGHDAAQAALIRILGRTHEYDRRRPALPWALGLATWECSLRLHRRARRQAPVDEAHSLVALALTTLGPLSPADQASLLAAHLAASASGPDVLQRLLAALRLRPDGD